jgi:hypothetical protein
MSKPSFEFLDKMFRRLAEARHQEVSEKKEITNKCKCRKGHCTCPFPHALSWRVSIESSIRDYLETWDRP